MTPNLPAAFLPKPLQNTQQPYQSTLIKLAKVLIEPLAGRGRGLVGVFGGSGVLPVHRREVGGILGLALRFALLHMQEWGCGVRGSGFGVRGWGSVRQG